ERVVVAELDSARERGRAELRVACSAVGQPAQVMQPRRGRHFAQGLVAGGTRGGEIPRDVQPARFRDRGILARPGLATDNAAYQRTQHALTLRYITRGRLPHP